VRRPKTHATGFEPGTLVDVFAKEAQEAMTTNTATYLRSLNREEGSPVVEARLYRMAEPVRYEDNGECITRYVVVSASNVPYSGPETYIFPADDQGAVLNWSELSGSFKGALDHDQAIRNAGWELSQPLAEEAALAITEIP
jgi:hypothetical protein